MLLCQDQIKIEIIRYVFFSNWKRASELNFISQLTNVLLKNTQQTIFISKKWYKQRFGNSDLVIVAFIPGHLKVQTSDIQTASLFRTATTTLAGGV